MQTNMPKSIYIYAYVPICISMELGRHALYIYVCMYACMYHRCLFYEFSHFTPLHMCVHVCMYVVMHECTHVCMYVD